jgi:DNA-binding NarL/FixJ family response regulator
LILQRESGRQIVGEASDGLEAVKKAQELEPDVILLDVCLPMLNGIEAARQIREIAPNSKILFLSASDSPDIAGEALRTGASGYVVKSAAGSELSKAMEAVIQGKRFVSSRLKGNISVEDTQATDGPGGNEIFASLSLPRKTEVTRRHEVQFYPDDGVLLQRVNHFIVNAVNAGNPAIVVATESHRNNLVQRLKAKGVDVDAAIQRGAYVSLDAADTLSTFMVNDWPDPVRFFEAFGKCIEATSKAATTEHPRVAIFGEGVALLCAEGKRGAAIRIEQLSNELAKEYDVDILCAYPFSSFCGEEDEQAFKTICAEHSALYS